jgi:Zn-dependent protease
MSPDAIFIIIIIVFSVIVHEVMHGVAADWLDDPTARYAGRLTINPLPHIDPIGSIIVPILSSFTGSFFGWAKPVPVNPYNFRGNREVGEAITAAAGPFSNLALALIFGTLIRLNIFASAQTSFLYVVAINCSLFLLNMIPIPPLDGSKILGAILPGSLGEGYQRLRQLLEHNFILALLLVLTLINIFGSAYSTLVYALASAIAGV